MVFKLFKNKFEKEIWNFYKNHVELCKPKNYKKENVAVKPDNSLGYQAVLVEFKNFKVNIYKWGILKQVFIYKTTKGEKLIYHNDNGWSVPKTDKVVKEFHEEAFIKIEEINKCFKKDRVETSVQVMLFLLRKKIVNSRKYNKKPYKKAFCIRLDC